MLTEKKKKNWTHQKNCLLHHELFVVWLDGVQEDIEPKWYQPLWCHDPEKNRRNIWFNIDSEFKAWWKKEKDDFSVSDTGGSEEKIRVPPTGVKPISAESRPWDKGGGGEGSSLLDPPLPMTIWLLIQILDHWVTGESWELFAGLCFHSSQPIIGRHSIERLHCDVAGWLVLEWLRWLPPRECFVLSSWGSFLEGPGNFSGPKAYFIVKTGWIAAQFLAHKPVNFASLTDRFILISFSNLLEPWSWMQTRRRWNSFSGMKQLFGAETLSGLSRKRPLGSFLVSPGNFSDPKSNIQIKILKTESAGPSQQTSLFCFFNWYLYHIICKATKTSILNRNNNSFHLEGTCSKANFEQNT